jgi:hypothetical protein
LPTANDKGFLTVVAPPHLNATMFVIAKAMFGGMAFSLKGSHPSFFSPLLTGRAF